MWLQSLSLLFFLHSNNKLQCFCDWTVKDYLSNHVMYQSIERLNIHPLPGHTPGIWSPLIGGGEFHVMSRADFMWVDK